MANRLVRGLDDDVRRSSRFVAAQNERSQEMQARAMATEAVAAATDAPPSERGSWFDRMHATARVRLTADDDERLEEWAADIGQRELPGPPVQLD